MKETTTYTAFGINTANSMSWYTVNLVGERAASYRYPDMSIPVEISDTFRNRGLGSGGALGQGYELDTLKAVF